MARQLEMTVRGEVTIRDGISYNGTLDVMSVPGMEIGQCFAVIPGTNLGTKRFSSVANLEFALRNREVAVS